MTEQITERLKALEAEAEAGQKLWQTSTRGARR